METELHPEKCMDRYEWFLRIMGMWRGDMDPSRAKLYTLFSAAAHILIAYSTVGLTMELYLHRNDLLSKLETIAVSISHVILCLKLYVLDFRTGEVQTIVNAIKGNFFIHGDELSTENRLVIKKVLRHAKIITMSYFAVGATASVMYHLMSPIVTRMHDEAEQREHNATHETEVILPQKIWFPFDESQSPIYEIVYVYTALIGLQETFSLMMIQMFSMALMIYLSGQFELLGEELRSTSSNVALRLQAGGRAPLQSAGRLSMMEARSVIPITSDRLASMQNVEDFLSLLPSSETELDSTESEFSTSVVQKEMEQYLVECIKHHQKLLDVSEKLDTLWTTVFFVQFLTASLLICFLGFQAMTMPIDHNFMKMLGYLSTVVTQLGLFCAIGSNLMTQSEAVYNAVYDSEWYRQSAHYTFCTAMIMMRAQRPVQITAGWFGTLSLPLYASLLQSSYSYLALLSSMHEE